MRYHEIINESTKPNMKELVGNLQYDLKRIPSQHPDFRLRVLTDNEAILDVRYLGYWVMPDGEEDDGDYDWEVLSSESRSQIEKTVSYFEKTHNVKVEVQISEKNWIEFLIKGEPVDAKVAQKANDALKQNLIKINGKKFGKVVFAVKETLEGYEVGWSLTFNGITSAQAIEDNREAIFKADSLLISIMHQFKQYLYGIRFFSEEAYKRRDKFATASDVKGQNTITGSALFTAKIDAHIQDQRNNALQQLEGVTVPYMVPPTLVKASEKSVPPITQPSSDMPVVEKSQLIRQVNNILKPTTFRLKTGDKTNTKVFVFTSGVYTGKIEATKFGAWLKQNDVGTETISKVEEVLKNLK